jgi:hypothetical protein
MVRTLDLAGVMDWHEQIVNRGVLEVLQARIILRSSVKCNTLNIAAIGLGHDYARITAH